MLSGTCAESIVAGVHFGEVSVDGGALGRVVCAVQAAVTDGVEIAAVWGRDKTRGAGGMREKPENRHEDLNLSSLRGVLRNANAQTQVFRVFIFSSKGKKNIFT